jgi:polyisoprenoid-binding protein YceI
MSEKVKSEDNNRRLFTLIVIIGIVVVLIGAIGYGAFIFLSGTGEASVAIDDAISTIDAQEGQVVYQIDETQSTARFYINEVLNGEDITVIGETSEVGGQMVVNFDNPAESEIGEMLMNAATLETDNQNRNRALRLFIFQTMNPENEFIRFQPTGLVGLPTDSVAAGEALEFQIAGDLTVTGTTNEVLFDATVTLTDEETITGTATTTIQYPEYGISFRSPPQVASVEDDVRLEIEFVALPVDESDETDDGDADTDSADTENEE